MKNFEAITEFLFGATGGLIAISIIGRSGAHINPVVTMAFWLFSENWFTNCYVYVLAQLIGAVIGNLPLLLWDRWAKAWLWRYIAVGDIQWAPCYLVKSLPLYMYPADNFVGFRQIRAYTLQFFRFSTQSWSPWSLRYREPARIPPVFSRHLFRVNGRMVDLLDWPH
jgi:aquaporin Z